jgi:hypothetical protein
MAIICKHISQGLQQDGYWRDTEAEGVGGAGLGVLAQSSHTKPVTLARVAAAQSVAVPPRAGTTDRAVDQLDNDRVGVLEERYRRWAALP